MDEDEIINRQLREIQMLKSGASLSDINEERVKRKPNGSYQPKPPPLSEDELALAFCDRYAIDWRHVAEWNRWFSWSGKQWEAEKTRLVFEKARDICRELKASRRLKVASAIETLSRSDRRCAALIDQWDSDLWLANTENGTIPNENK